MDDDTTTIDEQALVRAPTEAEVEAATLRVRISELDRVIEQLSRDRAVYVRMLAEADLR